MTTAMAYVRLLFVCAIMFAIPFRGFAATGMESCEAHAGHPVEAGGHWHGARAQDQTLAASLTPIGKVGDGQAIQTPDYLHNCDACALCCQAAAMSASVPPWSTASWARANPEESTLAPYGCVLQLPDKPPRA